MNVRPIPAGLLRRLGEAAAGFSGGELWFVGSFEPDALESYEVMGPFASSAEASAAMPGDSRFGVCGPYVGGTLTMLGSVREPIATVTVRTPSESIELDATEYDCAFWGPAAIDKFVLPYYASSSGLLLASDVKRRCADPAALFLAHMPGSKAQINATPALVGRADLTVFTVGGTRSMI